MTALALRFEYQTGGKIHAYGCAPLTTGPPWLTTFVTPLTRL